MMKDFIKLLEKAVKKKEGKELPADKLMNAMAGEFVNVLYELKNKQCQTELCQTLKEYIT
jgi:hypothetical protein